MNALHDTFAERASTVTGVPFDGASLRAGAQRRRQRNRIAGAILATGVVVATAVVVTRPATTAVGPVGGERPAYAAWPLRGALDERSEEVSFARERWEEIAGPHRDVHPLYAVPGESGPLVVLTGVDRYGERRAALLLDGGLADEYTPAADAAHLGFRNLEPSLAVLVTPPGTNRVRIVEGSSSHEESVADGGAVWWTVASRPLIEVYRGDELVVSRRPLAREVNVAVPQVVPTRVDTSSQFTELRRAWLDRHGDRSGVVVTDPRSLPLPYGRVALAADLSAYGGPPHRVLAMADIVSGEITILVDAAYTVGRNRWQRSALLDDFVLVAVDDSVTRVDLLAGGRMVRSGRPPGGVGLFEVPSGTRDALTVRVFRGDVVVYEGELG